jgi:hypothetical protein
MGQSANGNLLGNANIPSGTTAQVTGFSIAGTTQVFPPGSKTPLNDPQTGLPMGTLTVAANGAYTFDPVDDYIGPSPAITIYSATPSGQTAVSSITFDVLPGEKQQSSVQAAWSPGTGASKHGAFIPPAL